MPLPVILIAPNPSRWMGSFPPIRNSPAFVAGFAPPLCSSAAANSIFDPMLLLESALCEKQAQFRLRCRSRSERFSPGENFRLGPKRAPSGRPDGHYEVGCQHVSHVLDSVQVIRSRKGG